MADETPDRWEEIKEAARLAAERRREARRLRKIADETDVEADRIEAAVGLVPIAPGEIDGAANA